MRTYQVNNTVLINVCVHKMYFIVVVFVRKLSKDIINVFFWSWGMYAHMYIRMLYYWNKLGRMVFMQPKSIAKLTNVR